MSRRPHKPTKETRGIVKSYTAVGVPQEDLATLLDIDSKTLRKHYREELDTSLIKANATVHGALYEKAKAGDVSAIIWWEKTRANKRDNLDLSSQDGSMRPASITIEHVTTGKK
jgi:hypothetical protein